MFAVLVWHAPSRDSDVVLRLKQIELFGFKSFCNRERLRFSGRGVAAVVGPNGCGKSNICDAANWVLGEQSAKSLRGRRMHDVIFNGTRKRAPAGLATVTLTLHDPDDALGTLFHGIGWKGSAKVPVGKKSGEVTVTRKLFANGDSQYILNGTVVRLRDVRDLFLGSGLGPNHYAIIEQGRIGQLLSARASDRRTFVEEAAGITRFKARRRQSELKLANASLNLERVHDIFQEVSRQANSLKRQAQRAARHERYQKQMREALRLVFAGRFQMMERELAQLRTEAEKSRAHLLAANAETERLEAKFAERSVREQRWESRLEQAREELAGLRIDTERRQERIQQQSRAIAENLGRVRRASRALESASEHVRAMRDSVGGERAKVAALETESESLRERLAEKARECERQKAAVSSMVDAQETCRGNLLKKLNQVFRERARIGQIETDLASQASRLKRARERRKNAVEQLVQIESQAKRNQEQAEELAGRVQEKAGRREALKRAIEERGIELGILRKSVTDEHAAVSRLTARSDSLEEMLTHRAYATDAIKELFDAADTAGQSGFRPLGILGDFLEVDEGYEKAIEQLLGDDLEHVVVGDWGHADRGVDLVRGEIGGKASFLVCMSTKPDPAGIHLGPDRVLALAEHVRFSVPDVAPDPVPPRKLSNGYMVDSARVAERLAAANPDLFLLLRDGTWYHGNTVQAGRKESRGPLVLRQQLRELGPQLRAAELRSESADRNMSAAEESLRREQAELEVVRDRVQNLEIDAVAVEQSIRQAARLTRDLERAEAGSIAEIDRLEKDRSRSESLRREARLRRTQLASEYGALESELARLEERSRNAQMELASLEEERTALRTAAAALGERFSASKAAAGRAEAVLAEQEARMAESARQIERWREESQRFAADNESLLRRIASSEGRQEALRLKIDETSTELKSSRAGMGDLIEAVRKQRELVEQVRRQCSEKDIELGRAQSDFDHVARNCESELGESITEVAAQLPDGLDPDALEAAERLHRQLRDKIQRLGPVNVLALDEYKHVSERREFLETQQQDLLDAIRNTRKAIQEIDTVSREKFDTAFRAINANFRRVFATLFEGGIGEMRLTDPDNRGESGIEIVAQPPGKRLQNVALLSGGEKSLTVMALLLATFRHKPSPFCILDEVDSQLDEANTVRLRRLLQEMAPETQFILITHSKTMMEVAETLYGVTMGEAGVSKLVSVRMTGREADAKPAKAAADRAEAVGL